MEQQTNLAVLLVRGQEFFEVLEREDDAVYLRYPNGEEDVKLLSELSGFTLVEAKRIEKPGGEFVYYAAGAQHKLNYTGVKWYTKGGVHE